MSCNPELVSAFLDGELDEVILETVAKHLILCDSCCTTLTRLAQVRDVMVDHLALPDPESMTQSIMLAIKNEQILPVQDSFQQRLNRLGLARLRTSVARTEARSRG